MKAKIISTVILQIITFMLVLLMGGIGAFTLAFILFFILLFINYQLSKLIFNSYSRKKLLFYLLIILITPIMILFGRVLYDCLMAVTPVCSDTEGSLSLYNGEWGKGCVCIGEKISTCPYGFCKSYSYHCLGIIRGAKFRYQNKLFDTLEDWEDYCNLLGHVNVQSTNCFDKLNRTIEIRR